MIFGSIQSVKKLVIVRSDDAGRQYRYMLTSLKKQRINLRRLFRIIQEIKSIKKARFIDTLT